MSHQQCYGVLESPVSPQRLQGCSTRSLAVHARGLLSSRLRLHFIHFTLTVALDICTYTSCTTDFQLLSTSHSRIALGKSPLGPSNAARWSTTPVSTMNRSNILLLKSATIGSNDNLAQLIPEIRSIIYEWVFHGQRVKLSCSTNHCNCRPGDHCTRCNSRASHNSDRAPSLLFVNRQISCEALRAFYKSSTAVIYLELPAIFGGPFCQDNNTSNNHLSVVSNRSIRSS